MPCGKKKCCNLKHSILFFLLIFIKITAWAQSSIPTIDKTFAENIHSVLLYPDNGASVKKLLDPPIIALNSGHPLVLEFDDLNNQYQNYHVKVFPCTPEWKILNLNEVEYISEFNDLIISDYKLSFSTKITYYHYKITLPATKIGGNFIAYVYKEQKKNEPILTKRFCVNAARVSVGGRASVSNNNLKRNNYQQVDFGLNYGGYAVINPMADFKVYIRQNNRWDKVVTNLKPQYLRASEAKIDYQFYNGETDFEGGNEYRFFDMRSLRNKYVGVRSIQYTDYGYEVKLYREQWQGHKVYTFTNDFDGQFLIDHYENGQAEINGDYADVNFTLESAPLADNEELHVLGAFNNYTFSDASKMQYSEQNQAYEAKILLKQGIYNYQYVLKNTTLSTQSIQKTEGNHSKTQNTYEIFVYHKPVGGRSEQLVGYNQFQIFSR